MDMLNPKVVKVAEMVQNDFLCLTRDKHFFALYGRLVTTWENTCTAFIRVCVGRNLDGINEQLCGLVLRDIFLNQIRLLLISLLYSVFDSRQWL